MSDLVKRLRDIFNIVDSELGGVVSNVISEATDTIEIITAPDVDNKNFWHCLDILQDWINDGYHLVKDGDNYCLKGYYDLTIIAQGTSIRELLVNLVMSDE